MKISIFPRNIKFFDYFMKQQQLTAEAAGTLSGIFNDFANAAPKFIRINQLANEGHHLAREINRLLSLTFVTPIDREDIYQICIEQNDMLARIQAISTRVGLYGFREVPKPARELVMDLEQIAECHGKMIQFISRRIYEDGPMNRILEACADARRLLLVCTGELFEKAESKELDLVSVIKLSYIYDRIEELLTHTERFSFTLEKAGIKNA
ncbi:MAG: DUF47 family protein [Candidatus Delongbacteria bacterium]|nr:DUF47 family protein [Candidatus Delongbacteria bacterium]